MKLPLLVVLSLIAPAAIAGDYCKEARRAQRNLANDPHPVTVQGQGAASLGDDGTTAPRAPLENGNLFAQFPTTSRPGPQASTAASEAASSGTSLAAQARGGAMSSPKQRADREIRGVIRRLH